MAAPMTRDRICSCTGPANSNGADARLRIFAPYERGDCQRYRPVLTPNSL